MKQRIISRIACLLAASATLLVSGASQASPEFPGEIARLLAMECPPPCTLCHATPQGGGPVDKAWAGPLIFPGGLTRGDVSTVGPALGHSDTGGVTPPMPIDTDMDGTGDVQELRDQRNPNIKLDPATGVTDELICPPLYGCGARVAPQPPVDGSALAFALVVVGYLVLRSRRSA